VGGFFQVIYRNVGDRENRVELNMLTTEGGKHKNARWPLNMAFL
jgi:hypothetical protein